MTQHVVEPATAEQQADTIERYEEALAAGLPSEDAPMAINRAYRRLIPRWHFAMLNDERRRGVLDLVAGMRELEKEYEDQEVVLFHRADTSSAIGHAGGTATDR